RRQDRKADVRRRGQGRLAEEARSAHGNPGALHVEQEKRYLLAEVDRLCLGLGIEHPEQAAGLEQLPKGWRRQRPILKALVETLQAAADSKRR
ncbi:hypothetical protein ACNUI6_08035, partial [Pseudomonas aeruginosa]